MAATEIAFEQFLGALEATRGTAISAPTHLFHQGGTMKPTKTTRWAEERRGTRAKNYRHVITRKGCEWELPERDADVNTLPWWLNVFVQPVTSPTTPGGATNARLWSFVRNLGADNLKAFTGWFGDPNIQVYSADFCMGQEMTLKADATAEDGVLMASFKGMGGPVSKAADPVVPAAIAGNLMPAQWLQCWIDTSSAIGTTAVTGRVLSGEHTIRTGVSTKYMGGGPTADLGYTDVGTEQVSPVTTKIRLEVPDTAQWDLWNSGATVRLRMRYNGPLIEATFYEYVEVDTYGPLEVLDLGENAATNRVYEFTVNGMVDATLGSDLRVAVQNARTAL